MEALTNYKIITQTPGTLADFLYMVQNDALEAEGCSIRLKMPDPEIATDWEAWLKKEPEYPYCDTPQGTIFWGGD